MGNGAVMLGPDGLAFLFTVHSQASLTKNGAFGPGSRLPCRHFLEPLGIELQRSEDKG